MCVCVGERLDEKLLVLIWSSIWVENNDVIGEGIAVIGLHHRNYSNTVHRQCYDITVALPRCTMCMLLGDSCIVS